MTYNPYLHHGFPPGLMPMAGLALPQLGQMGVTVPTGVASVSAPPVRNIVTEQPSLLGAYPGMNMHMPHNGMHFPPQFHLQHQPMLHVKKPPPVEPTGPLITVFVGNITERAPDMLVRQLLSKCGSVNNWKRAQGANGKLQAFGFCDFSDPESAMRAIRILHQFDIADKKLVVKAGDKARELLIEYLKQKRPNVTASLEDEVDADTKRQDDDIRAQIIGILREHEIDLSKDMDNSGRDRSKKSDRNRGGESKANEGSIADMEMEEEKRSLIHREIDKFRDTYKKTEEKRDDKDRRETSDNSSRSSNRRDDRRDRDRDRERDRDRDREREKDRNRDDRSRRDRDRDRSAKGENRRERFGSRDRERENAKGFEEDDEDSYERRRLERKLREKESSYQERLHNWESREKRKNKENYREQEKEYQRKDEESIEAKRLKQFLEDYDDDRDDAKFYKGSALTRRLRERKHEIEEDKQDEALERQEIEELKKKLREEGHPDPDNEAAKRLNTNDNESERDRLVLAKLKELRNDAKLRIAKVEDDNSLGANSDSQPSEEMHVKSFSFTGMKIGNATQATAENNHGDDLKRKKMSEIFNANEDDDLHSSKRRKLITLVDDNDSNQSLLGSSAKASESKSSLSSEEKKKQIKNLIENIPTSKEELFKYEIEWSLVDNSLMDKRIRPWINKKITEYIGEEEQALLDFICTKINAKTSAQSILNDVAMVLDEEAEVFVVKMWRLLIYEIEAKKLGLAK